MADIRIKRVYEPPAKGDGARILVDRIWPRGLSKEKAQLTLWLKEIAPSTGLRKWFGHDPARWAEFQRRYRLELEANGAAVGELREVLKQGPATLLYGAHDEAHNQAVALADWLHEHR
ncbi:MAG TPA: DUF488 domain-containing protein [Sphingomonadaceae bacterium]|nr:DUF488 domain-containing protein [Sphingomonadaceae bacterium]